MSFFTGKLNKLIVSLLLSLVIIMAFPLTALADWSTDTTQNTCVVTAPNNQAAHYMEADGEGGFFIAWADYRNDSTTGWDIYAQHYDADGNALWGNNGLGVCTALNNQYTPRVCADGQGNCIISWEDDSNADEKIYLQKLGGDGVPLWGADVAATLNDSPGAYCPWMASDGQGGVFVSWNDANGIDVQHISSSGARLWASEVTVSGSLNSDGQKLVPDSQGGIFITWYEQGDTNYDILAQRLDSAGNKLWGANGVVVCDSELGNDCPRIIESSGDAIIMWQHDYSEGTQILVQKFNAGGVEQWASGGVTVSGPIKTYDSGLASDNAGGAIITWVDDNDLNIYAARVDSSGNLPWGSPVAMMNDGNVKDVSDSPRQTVEDGVGGAITVWTNNSSPNEVRVQRINQSGTVLWNQDGVLLSNAEGNKGCPRIVSCDSSGEHGAVAYWNDQRNSGMAKDIYLQAVTADGTLGKPCQCGQSFQSFDIKSASINWARTNRMVNLFTLSGRLQLPEGFDPATLAQEATLSIQIADATGTDTIELNTKSLGKKGKIQSYLGKEQSPGDGLNLNSLSIWWSPPTGKWAGWAGFTATGILQLPKEIGMRTTPSKATVKLSITTTTGLSLEGETEINYNPNFRSYLWTYVPRYKFPVFPFDPK